MWEQNQSDSKDELIVWENYKATHREKKIVAANVKSILKISLLSVDQIELLKRMLVS